MAIRGRHNNLLRRWGESAIDAALLRGLVARLSHRCGLQGTLGITRYEVRLTAAATLVAPLTIAFASDFHAGPTTDPELFTTLCALLVDAQPDVILLGGDFVSGKAAYVQALACELKYCRPPLGMYAVLGNHDLWADDAQIVSLLAAAGVQVLVNGNATLPPPFDCVSVCGIDDPWTGTPDVVRAFHQAQDIRIFLTHAPDGLLALRGQRFDVGFAGHTHGGQVAWPGGHPVLLPHGPLSKRYVHGEFHVQGGARLIVSRGIGCSTLPIRLNAHPELVLCILSSEVDR
jgi:predicted MPP superfamily phosphohydrolase